MALIFLSSRKIGRARIFRHRVQVNRINETFTTSTLVTGNCTTGPFSLLLQDFQPLTIDRDIIKSANFSSSFCARKEDGLNVVASISSNDNNNDDRGKVKIQTATSGNGQEWQKIEKLRQCSQIFLNSYEEMDAAQKSKEILRLVTEWGNVWRKSGHLDGLTIAGNGEKNDDTIVTPRILQTGVETVDKLTHILLDMEESSINDTNHAQESRDPKNIRTIHDGIFHIALGGWAMAPPSQMNGVNASKILDRLEKIFRKSPKNVKNIRPTSICYGSTIKAWAISVDSQSTNGAIKARNILENMLTAYNSGDNLSAKPNLIIFNSCLHAYALRGMVVEAEDLLSKMEKHCDTTDKNKSKSEVYLCPDVFSYSICMNAYAKSTGKDQKDTAAKRADNLLRRMMKRYERTGDRRYMPNQYTFGTVIALHANSNSYKGAQNAERILQWMLSLYEKELNGSDLKGQNVTTADTLKPSVGHFLGVLLAYSSRRIRGASEKAQGLLVHMEKLYQAGNEDLKPTYQCFIVCLDILVKSDEKHAAVKAEQVLDRLEDLYLDDTDCKLNNYGYNLVMNAWVRSGDKMAFKKAQNIMERMHNVYNDTRNEAIRPDKISYTALMNALINGREHGYAERAATILLDMEKEFHNGNKHMKPDTISYSTCIKAFGRSGNPERAEALITRMEELYAQGDKDIIPNISCYNALINAYAKSDREDSPQMVEDVLRRIDEINKKGKLQLSPNIITYTSCLDALSRSNAVDRVKRAEALFEWAIEKNDSGNNLPLWNVLLRVYAKSNMRNKAAKGLEVIERMENAGIEPELETYNTLLNACATTLAVSEMGSKKALEIAIEVFRLLRSGESFTPNSTTYTALFEICDRLIKDPEEKRQTIEKTFETCCMNGQVDWGVLSTLRRTVPDEIFWRLIDKPDGHGHVRVHDLPPEWSRKSNRNSRRLNLKSNYLKHST